MWEAYIDGIRNTSEKSLIYIAYLNYIEVDNEKITPFNQKTGTKNKLEIITTIATEYQSVSSPWEKDPKAMNISPTTTQDRVAWRRCTKNIKKEITFLSEPQTQMTPQKNI